MLNGQGIVQSKPGKDQVAQTQATKNSDSDFGKASYTARTIRNGLFTILQNMTDSKMYVRFTTKIYETALSATDLPKGQKRFADGDLSLMKNFEFNSNSLFAKYAVFKPQAMLNALRQIEISVPAIAPKNEVLFPTEATDCELCFMVTAFDKNDYAFIIGKTASSELFRSTAKRCIRYRFWVFLKRKEFKSIFCLKRCDGFVISNARRLLS